MKKITLILLGALLVLNCGQEGQVSSISLADITTSETTIPSPAGNYATDCEGFYIETETGNECVTNQELPLCCYIDPATGDGVCDGNLKDCPGDIYVCVDILGHYICEASGPSWPDPQESPTDNNNDYLPGEKEQPTAELEPNNNTEPSNEPDRQAPGEPLATTLYCCPVDAAGGLATDASCVTPRQNVDGSPLCLNDTIVAACSDPNDVTTCQTR